MNYNQDAEKAGQIKGKVTLQEVPWKEKSPKLNDHYISISNPEYQTEDYQETENYSKKDSRYNGLG